MTSSISPLRLPVRTESGTLLGHVVDVVVEPDTQSVVSYHVKQNRLVPSIVSSPLIIHRSQVLAIGPTEMVVDDATMNQRQPAPAPQPSQ